MKIKLIDFETIFPIWRDRLWPGRTDAIEPFSAMTIDRDYDMSFAESEPVFLAGYEGERIIAVNSCHLAGYNACGDLMARSRGLWVDEEFRGLGYGFKILDRTCDMAAGLGAELIWSYPRQSSFRTYEKVGFVQLSEWLENGENGPNCYAAKRLVGL
jgi:GNAT superfamily N-acetyltransferase